MSRVLDIVQRVLVGALLLAGLLYAGDYVFVRYKIAHPNSGGAFGSVQVERLYAIPLKDGKTEYDLDAQQPEVTTPCVHALFPHMGYSPCWYVQRNSQKPIPM
jgi:hypothetical protein